MSHYNGRGRGASWPLLPMEPRMRSCLLAAIVRAPHHSTQSLFLVSGMQRHFTRDLTLLWPRFSITPFMLHEGF